MHFLRKYAAREGTTKTGITDAAMVALLAFSWPGNVRELENAIERAVVLGPGPEIRIEDLPRACTNKTASSRRSCPPT